MNRSDRFEEVPLGAWPAPPEGPERASAAFLDRMRMRRSIRDFSDRPVSEAVVRNLVAAASTAPSGANKQPWRFVAVRDPALKRRIREGAEEEERTFYAERAGERWLRDLEPLGTDADKGFLEVAPWLIVVFKVLEDETGDGGVYYVNESVGLACGLFLAAAQHAGLATLTHTPSPMAFLGEILGRGKRERPFLLIPLGYPAEGCKVPAAALRKKSLDQVLVIEG